MSYETDRFLSKRSDDETTGRDYDSVIQSLEALLAYLFGAPVNVALTAPLGLAATGALTIQVSLTFSATSSVIVSKLVDTLTDDSDALPTAHAVKQYVDDAIAAL